MEIKEAIKARRIEQGLTMLDVSKEVGVSEATISRWESGDIANMKRDKIVLLANALGMSPAVIMGWENSPAKSIFDYDNIMPLPKTRKVPLIGTIACGTPMLAEQNIEQYIDMDEGIRADYCLRCKGDSMINARIFDGDIVFVRQQDDVENGQIAVVLIDNEATLKRIYKQPGGLLLQPENPTHQPMFIADSALDGVRIQGRAVAFMSTVR